MASEKSFLFVFPIMSGHINPSFPVARALRSAGHTVTYICRDVMRSAIEGTGATFQNEIEVFPELYRGREPDMMGLGATETLKKELGLEGKPFMETTSVLNPVHLELKLPGLIRWLKESHPSAVLFCPMICQEAGWAARIVGIPSVGLITEAGPGMVPLIYEGHLQIDGWSPDDFLQKVNGNKLKRARIKAINKQYNLDIPLEMTMLGKLEVTKCSYVTLVTTPDEFQIPMLPEMAEEYLKDGAKFEGVGPLLEEHADRAQGSKEAAAGQESVEDIVTEVKKAKSRGRKVVYVSLGNVITGDSPDFGWEGRNTDDDGKKRGLTGREFCRAAWGAAFDAFGKSRGFVGPLILISLGPQTNPLGDLEIPTNAVCLPSVPQVEILKIGVDVFITHGGQRSFTEALSSGTPLVVCPVFGDHFENASNAEQLGVGIQLPCPDPDAGSEAPAAAKYREDIAEAMLSVLSDGDKYAKTAKEISARLAGAGGVPRVIRRLEDAISGKAYTRVQKTLMARIQQPNRDAHISEVKEAGGSTMLQRPKDAVMGDIKQPAKGALVSKVRDAGGTTSSKP